MFISGIASTNFSLFELAMLHDLFRTFCSVFTFLLLCFVNLLENVDEIVFEYICFQVEWNRCSVYYLRICVVLKSNETFLLSCRKKRIEEALLKMPEIVAEYHKRIYALREKRRNDRLKNKVKLDKIKAMGLHPNDPRAKRILHEGTFGDDKKKESTRTKKKFQRKAK